MVAVVFPHKLQPCLCKVCLCPLHLLLAKGDASDLNTSMLVHVGSCGAPAHAKVCHLHAILQLKLSPYQVKLVGLSLVQRRCVAPVGAGVRHGGPQHPLVQVVARVIMLLRHAGRPLPSLLVEKAPGQGSGQADHVHDEDHVVRTLLPTRPKASAVQQSQEEGERVHLDLAVHIALGNPQIALCNDVIPSSWVAELDMVIQ
mmetsp:Transcript_5598/g.16193  ORF Transcript_5598/g.16193 Transcript_5598/m.16193 type:complete len:201 (-) Transcript_5598:209-811(-)